MNEIRVEVVDWLSTEALRDIRRHVFIDEQLVPEDLEWDEDDHSATHFLMHDQGQPIGTARLLADGHIGRVAILPDWRGKSLGERLMREVMAHAEQQGMQQLLLSAQVYAIPFYQRLGYVVTSDEYVEAGIPHVAMSWQAEQMSDSGDLPAIEFNSPGRFSIHNPELEIRPARVPDLPYRLGEQREMIEMDEHQAVEHLCLMLSQVRRRVLVYAADQAVWLFNRRDVVDSIAQLIARQPKCRIRILLHEAGSAFLKGHSLLNLMHRFPSMIDIRVQHPERVKGLHVYTLMDDDGILMLPKLGQRQGFVRYCSPDQVKRWSNTHEDLWASSQTDPAIRRFLL